MKLKHLLFAALTAVLSLSATAAETTSSVRIYINPGHGSFTGSDRPMSTIKHGNQTSTNVSSDTSSFFESNTNLQKGFGLLEKLKEYGIPYNSSIQANNAKQTNLRMSHVKCGTSRNLSDIAAEAESWNADYFISIHSNATTGDHNVPTHYNHCLYLYRGYDGNPKVSGSDKMATASWPHALSNKHMNWNWLSEPTKPRDVNKNDYVQGQNYYPIGKYDADGNPYWIKGDLDFMYEADLKDGVVSTYGYYGVLAHNVPGFLVEGYDHTYQPAMHRAMNDDVCRHEGEMYARGINDYFGWGKKDSYGKIYGVVRDHSVVMDHPFYQVTMSTTIDANKTINQIDNKKPLNGVTVELYNSSGKMIDSYLTDDEWNGAYMFKKVAPGSYTIKHSRPGYGDVTQSVTVTANQTNYINIDMRTVADGTAVQGHYAYGLSLTESSDKKTYTASFKSTGAMSNGKIILTNKSTGAQTVIQTGAINKGSNSVTIDAQTLETDEKYSWAVVFDNPASKGYKLLKEDNSITYTGTYKARVGVAVDNDETSANFGTIYTITGYGQGMQKFNPDFSKNGSKFMTSYFGISDISNPVRLETNGGKVYIANYDNSSAGVWVWNPSTSNHSRVISTKASGVAFSGTGSNRKMYISGPSFAYGYNIGTADSWSSSASTTFSNIGKLLVNGDGDIYVTDNAIIASQIRYSPNNVIDVPSFAVSDLSRNIKFNSKELNTEATDGSSLEGSNGGGFAFSKDKSIFAIQDGSSDNTKYEAPVKIYSVKWNGSTPTFIYHYTITLSGTYAVDQIAFDHADNLYIASRQKGLLVYAIKTPARQTVTNGSGTIKGAKSPLYLVGNSNAVGNWDPYKAVEFTNNGQNYTITLDETVTEFKISNIKSEASGDWTEFDKGIHSADAAITNGGTVTLSHKNGSNIVLPWAGVWNITVAGDLSTLTATTSTPRPLYIVGNTEELGAWDTEKAIKVAHDGKNYNITLDENVTAFKISTSKGDEATFNNGNLAISDAITNGETVNLVANKDGGNIVLPWDGVWNITISNDLSKLTATTETPKPLTPLYIVGNTEELGAWNTENAVEVSNNRINYSITLDESVTAFKISTNKGDATTFNNGNLAIGGTITNGGTVNLIADKNGGNINLPWEGIWNVTIAGDLTTLHAFTSTPDPNVGPGIGPEPENAPNPDAETPDTPDTPDVDESEDAQTEGYFTYDLSSTQSGNNCVFKFKSTGARKNGRIILTNKSTGATIEFKTGEIKKGENSVTINAYDIAKGDYSWAVKINNGQINESKLLISDNSITYHNGSYQCRGGVAIDNDQTSANFGTIYASVGGAKGIQRYYPNRTKNGGFILGSNFYSGNIHSPFRLRTNSGKLYITDYYIGHGGVYVYNPSAGEKVTNIFTSSNTIPATGIAFTGSGSSRKLYAFDGAATSMGAASNVLKVKRYDIGTSDSWTAASPSAQLNAVSALLINGNVEIIPSEKGLFVSQTRYTNADGAKVPSFVHITADGTINFNSGSDLTSLNGNNGGAMAIYKNVFATVNGSGNIEIYNLTFSGNTPKFSYQYTITTNSATTEINQMDFDHAGNLYAFSRHEGLLGYSIKMNAQPITTNAMPKYTIAGMANPAPTNVVATRKCYNEGSNNTAGTVDAEITWKGEAGQYRIYYQTMRRDVSGNRVEDNSTWQLAGTANIASGATTGKYTHQNLAHGGDYARIYNYKVVNYYSSANHEGLSKSISGKGRTVTSYPPQVPINVAFTQSSVEVDGVTQYTLDPQLNISLNTDVFNASLLDDNDEPVKATKYVVVVDAATAKILNRASNVDEVGRFYCGPATMTANNCNHYVINDWYMVVDFDDVTPSGDLSKANKSLVWKDVDFDYTYKAQVYTSAVRTFNFTANALESATCKISFPITQWKANSNDGSGIGNVAEAIPVTGNIIESLVGNEDYPMGTFQKIGDIENPTNPISITEANVIGAVGCIDPLPVTDDVLNDWDITYTLILKDKEGNVISEAVQESSTTNKELYSNTQKRIVDILGLNVGRDETTAPDGRARYTYNAEKNENYTLVVRTTYRKTVDGKLVEKTNESEAPITVNPSFPNPELDAPNSPGYLFLEESTHWDEKANIEGDDDEHGGYFKYFYDVAMDIKWQEFNDNLVRYMGYYSKSDKGFECVGHPVESDKWWTPYQAASVLFDEVVTRYNNRITDNGKKETEDILRGIGYTGTENWSALATEAGHIPVKVHYVWAGNEKLTNRYDASIFWELSANYPMVIYDEPMIKVSSTYQEGVHDISAPLTRNAVGGKDMYVITAIDRTFDNKIVMGDIIEVKDEITTGVEDVNVAKGSLRLYPNPANSIVTLQAWTVLDDVKIFTIDGQLVKEFDADDTKVKINVSDLPTGVYIVHAAGTTTRLIKR